MSTITNSKVPAAAVVGPPKPPASSAVPAATAQKPALNFDRNKFPGLKLAKLRLMQSGIIQYDPAYPELVLNTTSEEGQILPLTGFFSGRLGKTVELLGLIEE